MREIYCVLWTGQNNSIHHWRNSICQRQDFRLDESPSTERKGSHEDMVTCGLSATKFMRFTERYSYYRIDVSQSISYLCVSIVGIPLVRMKISATYRWKIIGLSWRSIPLINLRKEFYDVIVLNLYHWHSPIFFSLSHINTALYTGDNRDLREEVI